MTHHYEVLGIGRCFTEAELKAVYRALASRLHPDRLGGTPEANSAFAAVTGAYATLSDPKLRKKYDDALDLLTLRCESCEGSGVVWKQRGFVDRTKAVCSACKGSGRMEIALRSRRLREKSKGGK